MKKNNKPICCELFGEPIQSDKICIAVRDINGRYINMWVSKSFLKKLENYVHTTGSYSQPVQLSLSRNKE